MSHEQPMFKNPPLLQFLLAICAAETDPSKPLRYFTGFDVLETNVAMATARQYGFVGPASVDPASVEPVTLTPQGRAWALAQLAPFAALVATAMPDLTTHVEG